MSVRATRSARSRPPSAFPATCPSRGGRSTPTAASPCTCTSTAWAGLTSAGCRPDVGTAHPGLDSVNHGFAAEYCGGPRGSPGLCLRPQRGAARPTRSSAARPWWAPRSEASNATSTGPGGGHGHRLGPDPDTTGPIAVDAYVGTDAGSRTGVSRPDVAQVFSGGGKCWLCRSASGPPRRPPPAVHLRHQRRLGHREPPARAAPHRGGAGRGAVVATSSTIRLFAGAHLQGWVVDPDTSAPVDCTCTSTATGRRPPPRRSPARRGRRPAARGQGFALDVGMTSGTHTVCTYAINVGAGSSNPQIGCRQVTVSAARSATSSRSTASTTSSGVQGWAIDPDNPRAPLLRVKVRGPTALTSNRDGRSRRPDVGAGVPGFAPRVPADVVSMPGPHTVCVVALNVGPGTPTPPSGVVSSDPSGSPGRGSWLSLASWSTPNSEVPERWPQ